MSCEKNTYVFSISIAVRRRESHRLKVRICRGSVADHSPFYSCFACLHGAKVSIYGHIGAFNVGDDKDPG